MTRQVIGIGDRRLVAEVDGVEHPIAPTVVFANALGTDMRIWRKVLALLPEGLRLVRHDMGGHGLSAAAGGPVSMGGLIADAAAVCDALAVRDAVFVGLSLGGLVAQGLAVKRPDLVGALVLADTAARIGTRALWQARIAALRAGGMAGLADAEMARWFSKGFAAGPEAAPYRAMFCATSAEAYAGGCAALAGADFYATTAALRLPALGIAGSADQVTPPDLVRETTGLIPGARFHLLRGTGHLSCAEDPIGFAEALTGFLAASGRLGA